MENSNDHVCLEGYSDDRFSYQFVMNGLCFLVAFNMALFLPIKSPSQDGNMTCNERFHNITPCFKKYRSLLGRNPAPISSENKVSAIIFLVTTILVNLVPVAIWCTMRFALYPVCTCSDKEMCKCTVVQVYGIPVGSCVGVATAWSTIWLIFSLLVVYEAARPLAKILCGAP